MDVVRQKGGHAIRCNDGEFEALSAIVAAGLPVVSDKKAHAHLSRGGKRAIHSDQFKHASGPLVVTQDKRASGEDEF